MATAGWTGGDPPEGQTPRPVSTVWRGTEQMQEEPGSPHEIFMWDQWQATRRFRGKYTDLKANRPLAGQRMGETEYYISKVELIKQAGGTGLMIVHLNTLITSGTGGAANDITYEVEWMPIEKPLVAAPVFVSGTYALDADDHEKIDVWQNERSAANYGALSANAKKFADKILEGIETFLLAAPVARKTTRSALKPTSSACGKRQTPANFPGLPQGYVWLKTADRAIKPGDNAPWERVEEWTGADKWDTDLYPTS